MSENGSGVGDAATNLHTLATSMATMARLLNRRDEDGALMPANAALIRAALATTHAEITRITTMLTELASEPHCPQREEIPSLLTKTAGLHNVLEAMENALRSLGG